MPLPVQWGDVATWVQALGGLSQLGYVMWSEHLRRSQDLATKIQSLTSADDAVLAERIAERPDVGELLLQGVEAAARAAAEEKRWMLARVVAAAFEDDARIEELDVLLRSVASLETYHVRVLAHLAVPRPGKGATAGSLLEGAMVEDELAALLDPEQRDLLRPILGTLEREGLVRDVAVGTWGYRPAWGIEKFGRRLLAFIDPSERPDYTAAELVVIAHWPNELVVKNLGPGAAVLEGLEATADQRPIGGVTAPVTIDAGDSHVVRIGDVDPHGGAQVCWRWTDSAGRRRQSDDLLWRRGK